ncbi:MAG: fused MFS/spermidine synthase [Pseudomonadota bacterium]
MKDLRKQFFTAILFVLANALGLPTLAETIEVKESRYNTIVISKTGNYVSMKFGHNTKLYTESVVNLDDPTELPVTYTRAMTAGLSYISDPENIVEIGSGGGTIISYLNGFMGDQARFTTVELDPQVLALSQKYFEFEGGPNVQVVEQDGRLFLLRTKETYDIIMVDAYRGPFVPFHLLTKEFYELIDRRLNTGGVVVQNVEPSTMLFDAAIATIGSVFDNVDVFPAGGNVVVTAYQGAPRAQDDLLRIASQHDQDFAFRYPLSQIVDTRRIVNFDSFSADILTDDFAPAQYLRSIELHNRRYEEISE